MQGSSCSELVSVGERTENNEPEGVEEICRGYAGDMQGNEPGRGIGCYLSLVLSFYRC